jgi:predicted esterase
VGVPRLFVTHGTGDRVLPIDACSRRLVPRLESAGYPMRYVEFDGGHVVPPALAAEALRWVLDADGGAGSATG